MNLSRQEDIVLAIVVATLLFLLLSGFVISYLWLYHKRKLQHKNELSNMKLNFQQELLQAQLEIQEQTLRNIGQEIHDNIGQTLSLAKLHLNTVDLAKNSAQEKISSSKELVSKAIQDLRSLSKNLNSEALLSGGLVKAVAYELQLLENSGSYSTQLQVKCNGMDLPAQKELIVFRIVQEALNNCIKHAEANHISVLFDCTEDAFTLCIEDNGKGFGKEHTNEGTGLINMRNRAALIGGTLTIDSTAKGTLIFLTLPTS